MPDMESGAAATTGLTQATVAEQAPGPSAEAQELKALKEGYSKVGLDLSKLSPAEVRKTIDTLRKVSQFDFAAASKAEALRLAEDEIRRREDLRKAKAKSRYAAEAGEEVEEEDDPETKLDKRIAAMEQRAQEREQSEAQRAQDQALQGMWMKEYQEAARDYPILTQNVDVAQAVQIVALGAIAASGNDPKTARAAERPGYVKSLIPTVLSQLLRAGRAMSALVPDETDTRQAPAPEKFDFANASPEEYKDFLRAGVRRR